MLKKIFFTLTLFFVYIYVSGISSSHLNESPTLYKLIDDMKNYKYQDGPHPKHGGDLFQHTMWVYFTAIDFVEHGSFYSTNLKLSDREKDIFYVAALVHDIGKAGRKELFDKTHPSLAYQVTKDNQNNVTSIDFFPDKEEHCTVSFEYLATPFLAKDNSVYKPRFYVLKDGKTKLNLDRLFSEMGITNDERKEIAIIAGMHWSFGNLRRGLISNETFVAKIKELADACHYTAGITEKLLRLSILIQVADVKGLHPVTQQKSAFLKKEFLATDLAPVRPLCQPNPFEQFEYYDPTKKALAMRIMENLLIFFKMYQQQESAIQSTETSNKLACAVN